MKQFKRIFLMLILIVIVGFGGSLTLKAAVGVGGYDALVQSLSFLSGIKVGTVGVILNSSCVLGQLVLLRKQFKLEHLLQLPFSLLLGIIINFFYYNVFVYIVTDLYVVNLLLLIIGFVIASAGVGAIMALDVVTFALEGFCLALANKANWKFPVVRQWADILSIILSILLTILFSLSLTVREGTLIGMLIFAPLMGFFMNKALSIFKRVGL